MGYKLDERLGFGKYKDFTVKEIYKGCQYPTQDFILDFLKHCFANLESFEFFDSKNKGYKLKVNNFEFLINNEVKIICQSNTAILPKNLTTDFNIALSSAEERPHRFIFDNANDFILKQRKDLSKDYKIFADPGYILWAIREVPEFYLDESDLIELKDTNINVFAGITLKPLHDDLYKYSIRHSEARRIIPDKIVAVNHQKILRNKNQF